MVLLRRVLAVLLFLLFALLAGIGGGLVIHLGLALYVLYLLGLFFFTSAVLDVLYDTLWD